jgi:hypothetical protein
MRTKREIVEDLLRGPVEIRPDFGALPVSFRLSGMPWGAMLIEYQMNMIDELKDGRLMIAEAEITEQPASGLRLNATNLLSVSSDFTIYKARDYLSPQSDKIDSTSLLDLADDMDNESKLELAAAMLIARFKYGDGTLFDNFEQQYAFESSVVAKKADEGHDIYVAGQYMTNTAFIIGAEARRSDYDEVMMRFRSARNRMESANAASRD